MGRIKDAPADQNLDALAKWLRLLRQQSGLSYSRLAHTAHDMNLPTSVGTLFRADKGRSLPAWKTVEAYVRSCDGSLSVARKLWTKAARAKVIVHDVEVRRRKAPAVAYINEPAELLMAMLELRLSAGQPTLRALSQKATPPGGGGSFLARSTLGSVLAGDRGCTEEFLIHFVRACGETNESTVQEWRRAWHRAHGCQALAEGYMIAS
ncbi:hypothetical protein ABZ990_00720 [Streptomyces sp. NPDC046203]|uniref:hypothetical protein n=1 Tax=Streptomyces sp. NPDC046203 TaxID=3154602 RepID=UPI0033F90DDF